MEPVLPPRVSFSWKHDSTQLARWVHHSLSTATLLVHKTACLGHDAIQPTTSSCHNASTLDFLTTGYIPPGQDCCHLCKPATFAPVLFQQVCTLLLGVLQQQLQQQGAFFYFFSTPLLYADLCNVQHAAWCQTQISSSWSVVTDVGLFTIAGSSSSGTGQCLVLGAPLPALHLKLHFTLFPDPAPLLPQYPPHPRMKALSQ